MVVLTLKDLEEYATSPVSNDWAHDVFTRDYVLTDQTRIRWYYYEPVICKYCGVHSDYYKVVSLFVGRPNILFKCDKCMNSIAGGVPCSLITGRHYGSKGLVF